MKIDHINAVDEIVAVTVDSSRLHDVIGADIATFVMDVITEFTVHASKPKFTTSNTFLTKTTFEILLLNTTIPLFELNVYKIYVHK